MNTFFITFLGGLLVFLLFLIVTGIIECIKGVDIMQSKLLWLIYWVIVFVMFLLGLTLDIASAKSDYTHTKTATERIVALNDNPGLKGSYYVKRGYIESQMYYNYMVDLGNNSYIANQVPVRKATIYETDGNYRIEWWIKEKGYFMTKQIEKYWKVYIPKNSILSEYEIDLK